MTSNTYAHPMLEPLDFDFDPKMASEKFSGDILAVYSLLWNASVASQVGGPLIKHKYIMGCLSDEYYIASSWYQIFEPGWGLLLGNELNKVIDSKCFFYTQGHNDLVSIYDNRFQNDIVAVSRETCLIDIPIVINGDVQVKVFSSLKCTYSSLIDEMAAYKIARPSTYSSRIDATIKNNMLVNTNDLLELTRKSVEILESIKKLPSSQRVDKAFSISVEKSIEKITGQSEIAGSELNKYTVDLFGQDAGLSKSLDNLDVNEFCNGEVKDKNNETQNSVNLIKPSDKEDHHFDVALTEIILSHNVASLVNYIEHAWDDYTFQIKLTNTKVEGRLRTRKADRLQVTKEEIFSEHLKDFNIITSYCLLPNIPYIDQVKNIEFSILTDRTKGFLYITDLVVTYDVIYEYNDFWLKEEDKKEFQQEINNAFEQIDYFGAVYLMSLWNKDEGAIIQYDYR